MSQIVANENLPFDFFSHHSYADVEDTLKMQAYVEERLSQAGLTPEIHLNEWYPQPNRATRGKSVDAARITAMMCAMQNTKMSVMCFYDARIGCSLYGGLFNPLTFQPFCAYYAFKAFGNLYKMETQVECTCDNPAVYSLMATDGNKSGVLLSNVGETTQIKTDFNGNLQAYLIDENNMMEPISINPKDFKLEQNQVIYIEGILQ